ncbi:MAG: septal ring lytic transglycosylase RlpA family protein, partial [Alphaproteobacteria bacterium]|nr:septal ring lytic transglycosylase RlpA family protein [Alphaproteobacteria bacterium]
MKKIVSLAVLTAMLAGCADLSTTGNNTSYGDGFGEEPLLATAPAQSLNDSYLLAAAPKYYIGTAYKVDDVQYIPVEDMTYNQTGVAGIIPTELNGTKTSNGEVFDINQMVATSKTLPLPTIARVTNLDNGQSTVVRINNRGPFVNTRLMDLSPAAAQKIGLNGQGKVQIQVLAEQSMAVKNATLGAAAPVATEAVAVVEQQPVAQ